MFLFEACNSFLGHCRSALSLSSHTLKAYTTDLNDTERYFGTRKPICNIDKESIRHYIRHLRETRGFKESSIKRRMATMKLLFKWSHQEELISTNPFDTLNERIRLPKRLPRALGSAHVGLLKKALSPAPRLDSFEALTRKAAINLLIETGIRVGELTNIRLDDLSLEDRSLKVHGKGNRQRQVYLISQPLIRALTSYLTARQKVQSDNTNLLITLNGSAIKPDGIRKSLREMAQQCGIEKRVTPHMLRHTCATQWLEAGLDIRYVQKLLGHHSISTTEIYTHVSDQGLRDALLRAAGGQKR